MLPRTVRCPQCGMEFPTQRSPGMQVNCPSCLTYFAVPLAAAMPPQTPIAAPETIPTPPSEPIEIAELPPIAIAETPPVAMPEIEAAPVQPRPKPAKAKSAKPAAKVAYVD